MLALTLFPCSIKQTNSMGGEGGTHLSSTTSAKTDEHHDQNTISKSKQNIKNNGN